MKNLRENILTLMVATALVAPTLTSCTDEPDGDNFFTFTGEMASDYLRNRPEYSDFTEIVSRANQQGNLMDMLSSYGHYTCFVPSNEAVQIYLHDLGLTSISQLTDADCDTIARTHIVNNMYSTIDMNTNSLATANLNGRYIGTADTLDAQGRSVIILEGLARINFDLKDDTVENGIMQPIDRVIEKSNSSIADLLRNDDRVGLFFQALRATGLEDELTSMVKDETYDPQAYPKYYYTSDFWKEVAWVPDTKKYGYTVFVEPDTVYQRKFRELGISTDGTAEGNLRAMYQLACHYYDHPDVYGADVDKPGHSFENLTDSVNPLKRFVQYHILNRKASNIDDLTPLIHKRMNEAFGIETTLANPVDWYHTLLPHTMIKIEQLTMVQYLGRGTRYERYVNRRYDDQFQFEGALIDKKVESGYVHDGLNGHFFYVDDIVAFSDDVKNKVQNMRIRMDFSTVFPEVMTNDMRLKGNYDQDDDSGTPDEAAVPKNGRNFYFPEGYLDGVSFSNCHLVLRRPHQNFWSWQGDEWNIFGEYDFTFRLPPVPYSGDWQIRLGFCGLKTRGVAQIYFDGIPQGIPLDMTQYLNEEAFIGSRFVNDETAADYDKMTDEEKAKEQKVLKNLGAYRAGRSIYHTNGSTKYFFIGNYRTFRRVLCQVHIDANKDHYLRFRVASDSKQGNDNEFMLDYLELVPKSVYGVGGDGEMEDDL